MELGYFTQPVAVNVDRFVFVFNANPANGDHLRLHYGTYWKPIKYKPYFHWSISDYGCSQCRENETTAGYHEQLQQPSSIDVSANEFKRLIKSTVGPFRR